MAGAGAEVGTQCRSGIPEERGVSVVCTEEGTSQLDISQWRAGGVWEGQYMRRVYSLRVYAKSIHSIC